MTIEHDAIIALRDALPHIHPIEPNMQLRFEIQKVLMGMIGRYGTPRVDATPLPHPYSKRVPFVGPKNIRDEA